MRFLLYSSYPFPPIFSHFMSLGAHFSSSSDQIPWPIVITFLCVLHGLLPPFLRPTHLTEPPCGFNPLLCLFHSCIQGAECSWRKTQPYWLYGGELREPNFSRHSGSSANPGHVTDIPRRPFTASLFQNSCFSL